MLIPHTPGVPASHPRTVAFNARPEAGNDGPTPLTIHCNGLIWHTTEPGTVPQVALRRCGPGVHYRWAAK